MQTCTCTSLLFYLGSIRIYSYWCKFASNELQSFLILITWSRCIQGIITRWWWIIFARRHRFNPTQHQTRLSEKPSPRFGVLPFWSPAFFFLLGVSSKVTCLPLFMFSACVLIFHIINQNTRSWDCNIPRFRNLGSFLIAYVCPRVLLTDLSFSYGKTPVKLRQPKASHQPSQVHPPIFFLPAKHTRDTEKQKLGLLVGSSHDL